MGASDPVDLKGRLHPTEVRLAAAASLTVGPGPAPLVVDAVRLDVKSVTRDGAPMAFDRWQRAGRESWTAGSPHQPVGLRGRSVRSPRTRGERRGEGGGGWGAYTMGPIVLHRLRTTLFRDLAAFFRDEVRWAQAS